MYLFGKFNIDLLKYGKDPKTQNVSNFYTFKWILFKSYYRITESTATLIIVNVHTDNMVSDPWVVDISEHFPMSTTLP